MTQPKAHLINEDIKFLVNNDSAGVIPPKFMKRRSPKSLNAIVDSIKLPNGKVDL